MKYLLVFLAAYFLPTCCPAQEGPLKPIIFIADASGSMWQKVGAEYKILIAKEVLTDLVGQMPDNQPVGLVAYGHRNKSDCNDIEELTPPESLDRALFTKKLNELNPNGKTPLALSVKAVIDKLKSQNSTATIILITDGIETCTGNLCDLVKEAKVAGIEFVLHIVGFDLKNEDKSLLECAANAGEGIYIDAADRDQLTGALAETSELTVDVPPGRLATRCLRDGELIDTKVVLFKMGTTEEVIAKRSYASENSNPIVFRVPAGTYDVEATLIAKRGVTSLKKSAVTVSEEIHEIVFDFTAGSFELSVTNMGEPHDATVHVYSRLTGKHAESGRTYTGPNSNPMIKELTPGFYDFVVKTVTISGDEIEHKVENVEIRAGEVTKMHHNFESAVLKVGASFGGELTDVTVQIYSEKTGKNVARGRTYNRPTTNPKSFLINPGKYRVDVKALKVPGNVTKSFTIELKAGGQVERIVEF